MRTRICFILAAVVFVPLTAHAQFVTGVDPGTALQAFVNWLIGPVGRPLITLGLMLAAVLMMIGRHTFEGLFFAGAGAVFFLGAPSIINILGGGQ